MDRERQRPLSIDGSLRQDAIRKSYIRHHVVRGIHHRCPNLYPWIASAWRVKGNAKRIVDAVLRERRPDSGSTHGSWGGYGIFKLFAESQIVRQFTCQETDLSSSCLIIGCHDCHLPRVEMYAVYGSVIGCGRAIWPSCSKIREWR